MSTERVTENVVRRHFDLFSKEVFVHEQKSTTPAIVKALRSASKHGPGAGYPEFIVEFKDDLDAVIVVECKLRTTAHASPRIKAGEPSEASDIVNFATDGVLHYARHISRVKNVIAIAVSGSSAKNIRVSTHRWLRGDSAPTVLTDSTGMDIERLATPKEYLRWLLDDPAVLRRNLDTLMATSRRIHNFLRDYAKVTEAEKPLVISAILLALRHGPFRAGWSVESDMDLPTAVYNAVDRSAKKAIPQANRRELMMAAYNFLLTHPELTKVTTLRPKGEAEQVASPLKYLVGTVASEVWPFADSYEHVDIIGQFYAEFLRYTGGDGRGLGIVLTPRHLTELFAQIANIGPSDTVIDACAGTGGFLISAMAEMDRRVGDDENARRIIRSERLIGIEQQPAMYALCVSNMILRGDGKSNLHRGDCMDPVLQRAIIKRSGVGGRPNKGLLNPPYSQKGQEQHELDFVKAMLDMLTPGGIGVAVVPMACALTAGAPSVRLLESHTLVAVMSLPDELFSPIGVSTCIMVLQAHTPHESTFTPTWFGYWKDDGFSKVKNLGRVDVDGRWAAIKEGWLDDFRRRAEIPGRCIQRHVTSADEWCAEAYMATDYSAISEDDFDAVVRDYALFALVGSEALEARSNGDTDTDIGSIS